MARLSLSFACGDYEIFHDLVSGAVQPEGVDLIALPEDKERIFRLDRRDECDIAEFNIVQYLKAREAGEPIAAIAVFPHRRFRHGSVYVHEKAGISAVTDLHGRRIGIGGYEPAAAVWLKGILQDQYGLDLGQVDWIDVFGSFGRLPDGQSEPLDPSDPAARHRIDQLLADAELDGMISAYAPVTTSAGGGSIRRLFADPRKEELAYYESERIFPVMHVVTIRQSVIDEHRWVPSSLMRAFTASRQSAMRRLRNPRTLPLAFGQAAWEEQDRVMGSDPWQYGLTDGNRRAVDAIVRYTQEQGLTRSRPGADALFEPTDREPSGPTAIV